MELGRIVPGRWARPHGSNAASEGRGRAEVRGPTSSSSPRGGGLAADGAAAGAGGRRRSCQNLEANGGGLEAVLGCGGCGMVSLHFGRGEREGARDPYLRRVWPSTQNALWLCLLCWRLFFLPKTLFNMQNGYGLHYGFSLGDSL